MPSVTFDRPEHLWDVMAVRGKHTAAEVLEAAGYAVVKTETREGVIVRTWRKTN